MEIKNFSIKVGNKEMGKAVLAYLVSLGYKPYSAGTYTYPYLLTSSTGAGIVEGSPGYVDYPGRVKFDAATEFDKFVDYISPKPVKKLTIDTNIAGQMYDIGFTKTHVTFDDTAYRDNPSTPATISNKVIKAAYNLVCVDLSDSVIVNKEVKVVISKTTFTKKQLKEIVEHPHFGVGA